MAYRVLLPDDVIPVSYDLALEPDLERFTFDGVVTITCDVQVATDVITVHARELTISEATFKPEGAAVMEANTIALKKKAQTASFTFDEPLPTGSGALKLKFRGCLNDQMAGFYRSQYTNSAGEKKFMATTQFEAIDARRCFPCWDEPARKATFTVTLTVPSELMALSNMPESRVEAVGKGMKKVSYLPTPKMSTYLLAFCIGEYEFIQATSKGGTLVRILATPGRLGECEYALKCGVRALEFYNDFFQVPFPLPKMDMIAIPDFAAGAMENWGLVTYREVALLCDEATVSTTMKQRICTVITHELAHQWFGNLVTMSWWDDLWLNEGFANWMQTFAADHLTPEWHIWESYVGSEQQRALQLDGLRSSHPIQVPIANASEVEEVFDAISYCKGGSMVRMLFAVLGYDNFQKGLQLYFGRHAYSNTETIDLATAWAEVSGMPIVELTESWTMKMGFPVLKITSDPFESGKLELEQSWFLADGSVQPGDEEVSWVVPVMMGSDSGVKAETVFMKEKKMTITDLPVIKGGSWLKLNFGQHVPCRVLYPPSMIKRFSANLATIPAEDRIGLLADTYATCKAGLASPTQLIDLLAGFENEENEMVWGELATCLGGLDKVLKAAFEQDQYQGFRAWATRLLTPCALRVGWDNKPGDSENAKKLRQTMIDLLANFCATEPSVWAQAKTKYQQVLEGSTAVPSDIRGAVMGIAVKNDPTSATFDELIKLHNGTSDGILKRDIYTAITAGGKALQERALEWCLSEEVKSQDMIWIPAGIAGAGKEAAQTTFMWVQEAYDRIHMRLGLTSMMLFGSIVRISGGGFVSAEKAEEVKAFWESKPVYDVVKKTVAQTVESIHANSKFADRLLGSELNKAEYWGSR